MGWAKMPEGVRDASNGSRKVGWWLLRLPTFLEEGFVPVAALSF
jgi:hypothetical protein